MSAYELAFQVHSRVICSAVMRAGLMPHLSHVVRPSDAQQSHSVTIKHEAACLNSFVQRYFRTKAYETFCQDVFMISTSNKLSLLMYLFLINFCILMPDDDSCNRNM